MSWAIGIDFGTSRSAGAVGEAIDNPTPTVDSLAGVRVAPLEIEGNRWVASMVLCAPGGELVVGTAADNLAGVHPERLERTPKRSLGGPAPLLLGGDAVDPRDAAAAVIGMIVAEGRLRAGGAAPEAAVLTHPVRWADVRRSALREAGERAGLQAIELVEEPVAAAVHYAAGQVAVGAHVGIYDLGGGTFDTAVLQRTERGFEVVGIPGGDEAIGGERFDHRLVTYFGECIADGDAEVWQQLRTSDDRKWRRAAMDLLEQARRAKEALSAYTSTQVFVPIADRDILVNRSQFEAMIIDDIERTVDLMEDTVVDAGLAVHDLAAVFLVGGSSRVPLVAQLMTERFGAKVVTRDEPKAVVALGAARLAAMRLAGGAVAAPAPLPRSGAAGALLAPPSVPRAPSGGSAVDATGTPRAAVWSAPTPVAAAQVAPVAIAWRLPLGGQPGQLSADERAVVFGDRQGTVRCVDPARGELLWRTPVGAPIWCAPALADDLVVVGAFDGRVAALERSTGAVRWMGGTSGPIGVRPAVVGGTVIVANDAGMVVGLDRLTGALRWELGVGSAVRADLAPTGRGAIVATTAGHTYAVDAETGGCSWGYRCGGGVATAPAVVADMVLVAAGDGIVYGLDLISGQARYGIRCSGRCVTGVAGSATSCAFVDEAGVLRVHRADTGQCLREVSVAGTQAAGVALFPHAACVTAFVDIGGDLVAVDLATGTTRFTVATGAGNRLAPVVSGGLVVVGTTFGQLYGIAAG